MEQIDMHILISISCKTPTIYICPLFCWPSYQHLLSWIGPGKAKPNQIGMSLEFVHPAAICKISHQWIIQSGLGKWHRGFLGLLHFFLKKCHCVPPSCLIIKNCLQHCNQLEGFSVVLNNETDILVLTKSNGIARMQVPELHGCGMSLGWAQASRIVLIFQIESVYSY